MKFELVGSIADVEVIAAGPGIRVRSYLNKAYGRAMAQDERDCYGSASEWRSALGGVTLV